MIKQSLRPTPLVFRYQASFIATFTLKCSLHIRICNIFYIFDTSACQAELIHSSTSELLRWLAALFGKLGYELWNNSPFVNLPKNCDGIKRTFYAGTQHVWEFSVDYSRTFYFSFTPTTHFLLRKLDISTFEKIAQFSLPKVQPAAEQSIMMDVFRGVESIAFCL